MVDIFSRRDGPRSEDVAARKMIEANRPKITAIADRLTAGGYSASHRAAQADAAAGAKAAEDGGRRIHAVHAGPAAQAEPSPYIRVSANNRVVVADATSGRQMQFLGELRRRDGHLCFVLATAENGFLSPVAPEMADALAGLDGTAFDGRHGDRRLAAEIAGRLGLDG